jgi:hypothetical protein
MALLIDAAWRLLLHSAANPPWQLASRALSSTITIERESNKWLPP